MKVKDVMHKGVEWVGPETPVIELAKLMRQHDIGAIPIGENDHLIGMVPEHPMPMVVVELDGGGRIYLQGTDCAEGEIAVGSRVRLTYRRLHQAGGNRNYYWKVRPA